MDEFIFRPTLVNLEDRLTPASPAQVIAAFAGVSAGTEIIAEVREHLNEPWGAYDKAFYSTYLPRIAQQNRDFAVVLNEYRIALQSQIAAGAASPALSAEAYRALGGEIWGQVNGLWADVLAVGYGAPVPASLLPPVPPTPPTADIQVTRSGGSSTVVPGASTTFNVTANNAGPIAVFGIKAADSFTQNLDNDFTWTAKYTKGSGPETGSSEFNPEFNLDAGGNVVFTITGHVSANPKSDVVNQSTITIPDGVIDPNPSNNLAFAKDDSGMVDKAPPLDVEDWKASGDQGLRTWDVVVGNGAEAVVGGRVSVHYTGWLTNGAQFDSSRPRGEPSTFSMSGVIQGWQQGIPGMKVGGIRRLDIPAELAYGAAGSPPSIPPNSRLIFEVKLLDIPAATTTTPTTTIPTTNV